MVELSTEFIMYIGIPSAVRSLNLSLNRSAINRTVVLNWMPPFSLDITGVDPDVTYCVEVVGRPIYRAEERVEERVEESKCRIDVTEFSYPIPLRSWCYDFSFAVIPSNVVGSGIPTSISLVSPEPEGSELKFLSPESAMCDYVL